MHFLLQRVSQLLFISDYQRDVGCSHLSFGDFNQNRCSCLTISFFIICSIYFWKLSSHNYQVNRGNIDLIGEMVKTSLLTFVCKRDQPLLSSVPCGCASVCLLVCIFVCQSDKLYWAVHGVWPVCDGTGTIQPVDQRWPLPLGSGGQVQNQNPQQFHFHSQWTFPLHFI